MQIHELNTKALTDPAYVAFDDGTDTYKADFKEVIDDAVAEAFSSADVSDGIVDYTSGDSDSPSSWSNVSVLTSGLSLKTLFERISTMIKNVRYIWNKFGTTNISSIGDGTVTGAISTINDNVNRNDALSLTKNASYIGDFSNNSYRMAGHIVLINGYFKFASTSVPNASTLFTLPSGYNFKCRQYIPISNNEFTINVNLEVRENTNIIRTGTSLVNLNTNHYYYFCFIADVI